jgi:hypothetical protein
VQLAILMIKSGCTRSVLLFKNIALKMPTLKRYNLFLHGILANLQEKQFSGSHPDLAEVKWCSPLGLILVMERAEAISLDGHSLYVGLKEKYQDDKMKEFLLSDCKPSNWGYIKDRLVKIDYGS